MKKIIFLLLLLVLLFSNCEKNDDDPNPDDQNHDGLNHDEIVIIPDTAFLSALIKEGIDLNEDGMISYYEAEKTDSFYIDGEGIVDMTGIEAFINLESLGCDGGDFKSIDLSNNTKLKYLCIYESIGKGCLVPNPMGKLESLDISEHTQLTKLVCRHQPVSFLDISNNKALEEIDVGYCYLLKEDGSARGKKSLLQWRFLSS